jgi:hypothetical protein
VRDVTAGESTFTRLEWPLSTCCTFTGTYLTNGHNYEFKVAAIGGPGVPDSPPSAPVSVTPLALPPTNLTATAGNGQVVLNFTESLTPSWYWIYVRDVTAGEANFTKLDWPLSTCCTFTAAYLTNGHTYQFKMSTVGFNGTLDSVSSNVVSATPTGPPPGAPSNLRATPGNGQVVLNWTASSTPGAWYWIYVRDVTAGEATFTRLEWPVSTCCTFTGTYLTNGHTYQFKVVTIGSPDSEPSNVVSVVPLALPPTNLTATAGNGQVVLNFTASLTPSWYWIYVRDVTAGESGFTKLDWPLSTCCTFTAAYLTNGHTYQFKVSAVGFNGTLDSVASNVVSTTPMAPPLAPPTNLTATAGDGQVGLTWVSGATPSWYWIYQRDVTAGESGFTRLPYPVSTCCSFTAGYLANGHTYEFKVAAAGSPGQPDSVPSNVVSSRPMPPFPQAPSGLTASVGNASVTLHWTASPTAGVYYWIYQRDVTTGQQWQRLPWPVTSCCTFNGGLLTNAHTYEWRLTAANLSGISGYSNTVSGRPMPPFPQPPTGLTATTGDASVTLHWTASPTAGVAYWIYQRDVTGGGGFVKLPYPILTCCTFNGGLLINGRTYEWKIVAGNEAGTSGYSNTVSGRPMPPLPATPGNVHATSAGPGRVTITWTGNTSNTSTTFYYLSYRLAGDSLWTNLPYPITARSWSFYDNDYRGDLYQFSVYANNITGSSGAADSNTVMLPDSRPGIFVHDRNNSNGANGLAWTLASDDCENRGWQLVCYDSFAPINPWTVGDYFLYPDDEVDFDNLLHCEAARRANIRYAEGRSKADAFGPDVLRHEERHSFQWSTVTNASIFIVMYLANPDYFENDANLYWGNYRNYMTERGITDRYSSGTLCMGYISIH